MPAAGHIFEFQVTDRPADWLTVIAPEDTLETLTADLRRRFAARLIAVRIACIACKPSPIEPRGVTETSAPGSPPGPAPKRHRWLQLERHRYRCRDCGMERTNYVHPDTREWQTAYNLPGHKPRTAPKVPPCPA